MCFEEQKIVCHVQYSGKVWWQIERLANLENQETWIKPSKLVISIDNPSADLFIHQTFFRQALENGKLVKYSLHQTFPLYGISLLLSADEIKLQSNLCYPDLQYLGTSVYRTGNLYQYTLIKQSSTNSD